MRDRTVERKKPKRDWNVNLGPVVLGGLKPAGVFYFIQSRADLHLETQMIVTAINSLAAGKKGKVRFAVGRQTVGLDGAKRELYNNTVSQQRVIIVYGRN